VEDLCGVRLGKGETFTDWSRRPLTREQTEYALNDVRYLLQVMQALRAELEQLGRLKWLEEELRFYESAATYVKSHETRYRKVRGAARLDRRELAVLRELTLWREQEAEKRDWPRARVLQDDLLVEIARRKPRKVESIEAIRGVHSRLLQRCGRAIIKRVQKALDLPESAWPPLRTRSADEGELAAVVDLLEVVLRVRAGESKIAPAYLGGRRDLLELARRELRPRAGDGTLEPVALLQGWRRRLVGEKLLGLLRGGAQVRVDPEGRRVCVEEVTGAD
jgi:ribonuclease D